MHHPEIRPLERLDIPLGNKTILALDGGGIRGIMTLQLLKALEAQAGAPCHEIFDMVAGTSTGGIIAGLIASGRTAAEIETLYQTLVAKVFTKRSPLASQLWDPPAWSKQNYRSLLKATLGDVTLEQACVAADLDLLITSHDVHEGEETFFSYVRGRAENAYATVLLRAAMEATMSAPTYFTPMERFVDGGTTTYNNPALAALLEAVQYGAEGRYRVGELTILSFGAGSRTEVVAVKDVPRPPTPQALFWLPWVMNESGNDASDMQSDLLRAGRVLQCDYRRFQVSLDKTAIAKLPDLALPGAHPAGAASLHDLSDAELAAIHLDSVAYFPVMQTIGEAFVAYLRDDARRRGASMFGYDLVDAAGKEPLLTRSGEVGAIAANMSDPQWVDRLET